MSLLMAGGLEPDNLQGPFQPLPFYDSIPLPFMVSSILLMVCQGHLLFLPVAQHICYVMPAASVNTNFFPSPHMF